jgi:hypothetical protein
MKSIIQFFSLLSVLTLFSVSCFATSSTNINEPTLKEDAINAPIRVTADLISATPCLDDKGDIQGFSATVRINVYATFGGTELLVASQTVNVPCGTVVTNNMTRPDFNDIATKVGSEGVSLVTDYLDENDENGAILKEIAIVLTDTMNSIKE